MAVPLSREIHLICEKVITVGMQMYRYMSDVNLNVDTGNYSCPLEHFCERISEVSVTMDIIGRHACSYYYDTSTHVWRKMDVNMSEGEIRVYIIE